ncbi:MAG: protein kinase [Candidatus Competibacter sp.]|nr:protein kinase [Candidatus Competibacter sp.]MDG4583543.1 protein kinase [Candidatus Competibacter sp.]
MQSGEQIAINGRSYRLGVILSPGAGSYGQVWAASDGAGRAAALKFINTEAMSQADPTLQGHWRAHLEREIAFLDGLSTEQSRHIVTLLDHGQIDNQPVLVLERLQANLGQWLARQRRNGAPPQELARILDWARQILTGLEVIHRAGFVYRDLKLSNILVGDDGDLLKLADFGSLKRENGDSTRSFIGTPATMAPEQALPIDRGAGGYEYVVDYRADYYALGLLLFSLLTEQPTTEAQRRLGQLLALHGQEGAGQRREQLGGLTEDERERLRRSIEFWTVPVLPEHGHGGAATLLTDLVERLLARDPAARPADSATIRAVLDMACSGQPILSTPVAEPDWDLPPSADPPRRHPHRAATPVFSPWLRRSVGLAGILGLAGALAWTLVLHTPDRTPQDRGEPPDAVASAPAAFDVAPPTQPAVLPTPAAAVADAPTPPTFLTMPEPPQDRDTAPIADPTDPPAPAETDAGTEPETGPATIVAAPDEAESVEPVEPAAVTTPPKTVAPAARKPIRPTRPKHPTPARTAKAAPTAPFVEEDAPATDARIAKPAPKATAPQAASRRTEKVAPTASARHTAKTAPIASSTTRPVAAPTKPSVARTASRPQPPPTSPPIEPKSQSQPTALALPPIELKSRSQPTPPILPPIKLVSRSNTTRAIPSAKPPIELVSRSNPATGAAGGVHNRPETFTRWVSRTSTAVGSEVRRGLESVSRAVSGNGETAQVERRDRWSSRYSERSDSIPQQRR